MIRRTSTFCAVSVTLLTANVIGWPFLTHFSYALYPLTSCLLTHTNILAFMYLYFFMFPVVCFFSTMVKTKSDDIYVNITTLEPFLVIFLQMCAKKKPLLCNHVLQMYNKTEETCACPCLVHARVCLCALANRPMLWLWFTAEASSPNKKSQRCLQHQHKEQE